MREDRDRREYDYVIVGAGAAGCVLAGRLSENPSVRVLLIEAGGSDAGLAVRVPLLTFLASATARRNWSFTTEPIPALDGRRQIWNQGLLIGGSSSINGMIYMRGHPREYDAWLAAGCQGWSFNTLLPYFKKCESNSRGAGFWHGDSGPVKVRPSGLDLPVCDAFLGAVRAAGLPVVDDLNAGDSEGFGRYDCNIDRGVRCSSARAYLHPVSARKNLRVICNTVALRVCVQGGRARGVEVLHKGVPRAYYAEKEIILCAGALNSPRLLMHSGIGPAEHLAEMGIPVAMDSPEVGENLRNHPAYIHQFHCIEPVTAYSYLSPVAGAKACIEYLCNRTGPLAESFSTIGGFMRSDPSVEVPDTVVAMGASLLQRAAGSLRWWNLLPKEHGFFLAVGLGRPYSIGRVRLRSGSPGDPPRIFPEYFSDPRDLPALSRSIQALRRAMRQPCISRYIDMRRDMGEFNDDLREIERSIRAASGSLSHPTGTCRMGSDARAVVDPQLRINGVTGLRVVDASVIPVALNACTHATVLMIGEKASAMIAGEVRERPTVP